MVGTNNKDGMYMLHNAKKKLHLFNTDYTRLIPPDNILPAFGPTAEFLGDLIKQFYFNDVEIDKYSLEQLSDLMTDYYFLFSQTIGIEMHTKYQNKLENKFRVL